MSSDVEVWESFMKKAAREQNCKMRQGVPSLWGSGKRQHVAWEEKKERRELALEGEVGENLDEQHRTLVSGPLMSTPKDTEYSVDKWELRKASEWRLPCD